MTNRPLVTQLSNQSNKITETTVKNLHTLADVLLTTPANFKLVVSAFTGYVYTNDRMLIDQVDKLPGVSYVEYTRAVVGRPRDTIQLRDPKYQWRSYFKVGKLTTEQKTHLKNFLANQPGIRISPALKNWINYKFTRTQDYFFIDYNEPAWLTMLGLVLPGLIRKTLEIIPAK
jgi:signal peptidase I